ncbi:MAG TPA: HAMP domain-containing sensor histidine kinase [Streptosporangiaceae bacterium]|nr:HAMP domain-containing sensor histidine kinase [Streptosporangiaceae bacterium]
MTTQRLRRRVPLTRWTAPVARSPEAGPRDASPTDARLSPPGSRDAGPGDAGPPAEGTPGAGSSAATSERRRVLQWPHLSWVDIAWVGFVALNLAAMRLLPAWQTVPFLAIWVSLTVIYGFRLWRLQPTILTLAAVTVATGGIIGVQVIKGKQDADYLAEVPLIALMFLVMVWHGRRRLAATEERLAAMEEVQRVSQENLRLLKQQRRFLQDASHELGTPITVALGHAELIERAVTNSVVADDAHVVTDELMRLRRLATRMLLLASADSPDFLHLEPVALESVAVEALDRWGHTPRRWRLSATAEATVLVDRDRLGLALDALLENAIAHTTAGDLIELGARRGNGQVILSVADSGSGIPAADLERIFHRFARSDPHRTREAGGFGLGLAIVQAIAEAHHGSARASSTLGHGSVFEVLLPVDPASSDPETPAPPGPMAARSSLGPVAGRKGLSAPGPGGWSLPPT